MPQPAKGSAYPDKGKWRAKVTIAGRRPSFALPTCTNRDEGNERARVLADIATRLCAAGLDHLAGGACEDAGKAATGAELVDVLNEVERTIANPPPPPEPEPVTGPTFEDVGKDWTDGKLHRLYPDHVRKKSSVGDDVYRLAKYVYPEIGPIPIADVTLADVERAMRRI